MERAWPTFARVASEETLRVASEVLRANDGGDEGHKGEDVGYAGGVVLDASTKRGELGQCALQEVKEGFEERGKASFLVWRYGEGS